MFVLGTLRRDASRRRSVASAQTRHSLDCDVFARKRIQFSQHFPGACQVTGQIAADSQHDLLGTREQEVGKETGHCLKPILRHARLSR